MSSKDPAMNAGRVVTDDLSPIRGVGGSRRVPLIGMHRGMCVVFGVVAVAAYDWTLRQWMLDWGTTPDERKVALPGDEIVEDVMTHHTRAITIDAPPEAVWPWLVQVGDHRAGWYSYDWIETYSLSRHGPPRRRTTLSNPDPP